MVSTHPDTLTAMKTSSLFRQNRLSQAWVCGLCLVVGLGLVPASAQRKRDRVSGSDTTLAKAGSTTTVRMEEETLFTEGIRYLMTDEPTKAITQFSKVLQKNPKNKTNTEDK